jgi:hypothetical protein
VGCQENQAVEGSKAGPWGGREVRRKKRKTQEEGRRGRLQEKDGRVRRRTGEE